jgi:CHAD domain-containing protein
VLASGRPLDRAPDVEQVHSLRVATRRLRTDLGTFDDCYTSSASDRARRELRWLGRALGSVRDLDVLEGRLRARRPELAIEDEEALTLLIDHLAAERANRARALGRLMGGARYLRLLETLRGLVRSEKHEPSIADARAKGAAAGAERVAVRWKALERAVRALRISSDDALVEPTDEALHAVRILAKRCRYAAEAMSAIVGDEARRFARAMTRVQSLLGSHQDTVAAEAWLRTPSATSGRTLLVAGELIMLERIDRARHREAFGEVWRRASRRKRRAWL